VLDGHDLGRVEDVHQKRVGAVELEGVVDVGVGLEETCHAGSGGRGGGTRGVRWHVRCGVGIGAHRAVVRAMCSFLCVCMCVEPHRTILKGQRVFIMEPSWYESIYELV
jgi:hypothetical protein